MASALSEPRQLRQRDLCGNFSATNWSRGRARTKAEREARTHCDDSLPSGAVYCRRHAKHRAGQKKSLNQGHLYEGCSSKQTNKEITERPIQVNSLTRASTRSLRRTSLYAGTWETKRETRRVRPRQRPPRPDIWQDPKTAPRQGESQRQPSGL